MSITKLADSLKASLSKMSPTLAASVRTMLLPIMEMYETTAANSDSSAKEILRVLEYIDFHTTPDDLASSDEYHHVKSVLVDSFRRSPTAQDDLERSSPGIEQVIDIMSQSKLDLFVQMLLQQEQPATNKLSELYPPEDASTEAQMFREFIKHHQVKYIGGGNSKNFKITPLVPSGAPDKVMKIDNRLNKSRKADVELHQTMPEHLLPTYVARQVRSQDARASVSISRTLLVTDFCPHGSLLNYRAKQAANNLIQESVDGLFLGMTDTLLALERNQFIFPDAKITNWLVDADGVLKIADTKSFEKTNHEGVIDDPDDELLKSPGFIVPELLKESVSAQKTHANLLGLNLYFYLTGNQLKLNLFQGPPIPENSFDNPVFKGKAGKQYKDLIEGLVNNTLTLAEAKQKLADIRNEKQRECTVSAIVVAPTTKQKEQSFGPQVVSADEWGDDDDEEQEEHVAAKLVNADEWGDDDDDDEEQEEHIAAKLVSPDKSINGKSQDKAKTTADRCSEMKKALQKQRMELVAEHGVDEDLEANEQAISLLRK